MAGTPEKTVEHILEICTEDQDHHGNTLLFDGIEQFLRWSTTTKMTEKKNYLKVLGEGGG